MMHADESGRWKCCSRVDHDEIATGAQSGDSLENGEP